MEAIHSKNILKYIKVFKEDEKDKDNHRELTHGELLEFYPIIKENLNKITIEANDILEKVVGKVYFIKRTELLKLYNKVIDHNKVFDTLPNVIELPNYIHSIDTDSLTLDNLININCYFNNNKLDLVIVSIETSQFVTIGFQKDRFFSELKDCMHYTTNKIKIWIKESFEQKANLKIEEFESAIFDSLTR